MQNKAIVVEKNENKEFSCTLQEVPTPTIQEGEILIQVSYSSLNYKDALSSTGHPGVSRNFPHITGIDAIGKVKESLHPSFAVGDTALVTGFDLGMNTQGGHQNHLKVNGDWAIHANDLPEKQYMVYGTAGFTAALSVYEIVNHASLPNKEVLVTGATGGVGSVAVSILSKLGYTVTALSGKSDKSEFLKSIGATHIIDRAELGEPSKKPMLSEKYGAVVDTVGGTILAEALKMTSYNGIVTCCGLTAGGDLSTNVYPFILRSVRLVGIESVNCDLEKRKIIWNHLATDWQINTLDKLTQLIGLEEVPSFYEKFIKGQVSGRIVVEL